MSVMLAALSCSGIPTIFNTKVLNSDIKSLGNNQYRYASSVTYECNKEDKKQLRYEDGETVKTFTCSEKGYWLPDDFTCAGEKILCTIYVILCVTLLNYKNAMSYSKYAT